MMRQPLARLVDDALETLPEVRRAVVAYKAARIRRGSVDLAGLWIDMMHARYVAWRYVPHTLTAEGQVEVQYAEA